MRLYRWIAMALVVTALLGGAAFAEKRKVSVALTYGSFAPTNSSTKSDFGSSWARLGLTSFEPDKEMAWRFTVDGGYYDLKGPQRSRLYPVSVGLTKGLSEKSSARPYVSVKGGPYYGKVDYPLTGQSETHIGLNVNASVGVVVSRRLYAEVRYDYFSKMAGYDFSGLSLAAGVRLFDL